VPDLQELISIVAERFAARASSKARQSGRRAHLRRMALVHLAVLPMALVLDELLLRAFCAGRAISFYPVLFALAAGTLISGLCSFFRGRTIYRMTLVIMVVAAVAFVAESMIYGAFKTYMSAGDILTGARDVAADFGGAVVATILGDVLKIAVFALPPAAYFLLAPRLVRPGRLARRRSAKVTAGGIVATLALALLASHGAYATTWGSQYGFDTATRTFGLVTSSCLDLRYRLFGNDAATSIMIDEDAEVRTVTEGDNAMDIDFDALEEGTTDKTILRLDAYVQSLTPSAKNEYTGLFEGKNLILICAEAFSDSVISEELTPTLYRLQHNGFYFSNYMQPSWGGSTSTGEFSFLMGLAPLDAVETMQEIVGHNNYFTLGNQLQRLDYYNIAYHNGSYNYYDRDVTHTYLGYENFLGYVAGSGAEAEGDSDNALENITLTAWAGDEVMLPTTAATYVDKQPFSIYYMTVSGHAPYTADGAAAQDGYLERVQEVFGDTYSQTVQAYLAYQLHLEDALTELVQMLEDAGIADDTVIVLTADHYPYGLDESAAWGNDQNYLLELYGVDSIDHPWENDHNALIIWSGCLENEDGDLTVEVSEPTSSLDVVPTLSNLFGLEYDSRLLVGRDVFSEQEALVFWNTGSWMTVRGNYDAEEQVFYPNDGYEADDAYVEEINTIVQNKLTFSGNVVDTDYYAYLFGEDNDVGLALPTTAATDDGTDDVSDDGPTGETGDADVAVDDSSGETGDADSENAS